MSTVTTDRKAPFLSRAGRWVAELVLIFVGVYGAFWLSNYQQHRQDAERRDRILASIEQTLRQGIESGKINRANEEREAVEFRRALDAGEMPSLHPFVFITDYSPGVFATMLQAGGIQLLDLQAEEDFAGVVHVHVVIHRTRYLVNIIWHMPQRPCASRRQLHPQSPAARECLGSPIDAQLPGLRAISAAGPSARELA